MNLLKNDRSFSIDPDYSSLGCSGCNRSFKYLEGDKEMIVAAILSLAVALYCYAITQLQQHGKFILSRKEHLGFWGIDSWRRKYKSRMGKDVPRGSFDFIEAPSNWYYKTFNIDFKEKFPLSATFLVFLTDGYHLFQALFFSFLSLSFALAIGFNWWWFLGIFIGVRIIHWSARKILSK